MSATAALTALGWAVLVVAVARRRRPAPSRVRAMPRCSRVGSEDVRTTGRRLPLPDRLGAWLIRRFARRRPAARSPLTARRLGLAILAAAAFVPVMPAAAVPAALVGWAAPAARARRTQRRRLAAIASDLPDVVDLLVLGVGAGLTVHLAVERVASRATGPLAEELRQVVGEVGLGRRLSEALEDLPRPGRAGEAVRPLVGALLASERYGAPLVDSLERLADEVRRDRRRRAEEAARKIPVKLLFPLVTCTLPAFGLLTVAPLIASAVRSLRL